MCLKWSQFIWNLATFSKLGTTGFQQKDISLSSQTILDADFFPSLEMSDSGKRFKESARSAFSILKYKSTH